MSGPIHALGVNPGLAKTKIKYYQEQLDSIVESMTQEVDFSQKITTKFCSALEPLLAYVSNGTLYVCPFLLVDLRAIPIEIRPSSWNDIRLFDLKYLQKLSDWISQEFSISKTKATGFHAAAAMTIIKLKQEPEGVKALRAGLAHEIGHIALEHNNRKHKCIKIKYLEIEADLFAVKKLKDGHEGIKIGFEAWQETLKTVRTSPHFSWGNRLIMHLLITKKGNLVPLLITHGSFKTRIERAQVYQKSKDEMLLQSEL